MDTTRETQRIETLIYCGQGIAVTRVDHLTTGEEPTCEQLIARNLGPGDALCSHLVLVCKDEDGSNLDLPIRKSLYVLGAGKTMTLFDRDSFSQAVEATNYDPPWSTASKVRQHKGNLLQFEFATVAGWERLHVGLGDLSQLHPSSGTSGRPTFAVNEVHRTGRPVGRQPQFFI